MLGLHTDLICSLLDAHSEESIKQERSTASFKIIKEEISLILSLPPPLLERKMLSATQLIPSCVYVARISLSLL